jgi:predicted dehydrogenase
MPDTISRRDFVKTGTTVAVATSLASARAYGANERIRAAFIGTGNRGGQLIEAAMPLNTIDIVALSDVYAPHAAKWKDKLGSNVTAHSDYRELLDRKDIDAIFIATPEHWHALQTIDACRAGKDVYVEKPLSYTIHEGRRIAEVAAETKRVVQVGLQRRSSTMYAEIRDLIQNGGIGKVTTATCYRLSNMSPTGMGKAADSVPPADLDWDLWLGPRPDRPFNETIAPYKFRWWQEYSSQAANWGVHYFDLFRWLMGGVAPSAVVALGGKFAVDDARTIPDTMHATFEFPAGWLMLFGHYEASGSPIFASKGAEIEIRGTNGTLFANSSRYTIVPETGGQFQETAPRMQPVEKKIDDGDIVQQHIANFLACIKSREATRVTPEEGHRSTTCAHLANIALATKSRIDWDEKTERITNNEAANTLLHYEYRAPWKLG